MMMQDKSRRTFVKNTLKASLATGLGAPFIFNAACTTPRSEEAGENADPLEWKQIQLPYGYADLEPHIDATTMEIHYERHHGAYVKNANEAMVEEGVNLGDEKEVFASIASFSTKLRNNAGGAWNHNFFWEIMKPGGAEIPGKLREALTQAFGTVDVFIQQFQGAAMGRFGSGWAWLIQNEDGLLITSTPNQDNPLMDVAETRGTPLLGIDVWEHAYYLHYQNRRAEYIQNWWKAVNFEAVAAHLK
jgi:superoxide dismutase, Fe-Mn family